jgi:hypothetical protein
MCKQHSHNQTEGWIHGQSTTSRQRRLLPDDLAGHDTVVLYHTTFPAPPDPRRPVPPRSPSGASGCWSGVEDYPPGAGPRPDAAAGRGNERPSSGCRCTCCSRPCRQSNTISIAAEGENGAQSPSRHPRQARQPRRWEPAFLPLLPGHRDGLLRLAPSCDAVCHYRARCRYSRAAACRSSSPLASAPRSRNYSSWPLASAPSWPPRHPPPAQR